MPDMPENPAAIRYCLLPRLERQHGGPQTFAGHLTRYLDEHGYVHHKAVDKDLDLLIVFVRAPLKTLFKAMLLRVPVALRLDGVYFRKKHGFLHPEYLKTNLRVWFIRKFLCDLNIYQSEFVKKQVESVLGPSSRPYRIIHNGITGPQAAKGPPEAQAGPGVRFVATGSFRGMDMLPKLILALDACRGEFAFTLDVFGKVPEPDRAWLDREYVKYHGQVPNAEVRNRLPGFDALLFSQASAPCPNSVVEAVSAGLPVLSFDTGSIRELAAFNPELIAETGPSLLHGPEDLDPAKLAACIRRFASSPEGYTAEARRHIHDYVEERTLRLYKEVLDSLVPGRRNPVPDPR
jgi:glycosyltransferase involved in cell wall biosynthesis